MTVGRYKGQTKAGIGNHHQYHGHVQCVISDVEKRGTSTQLCLTKSILREIYR